MRAPLPDTSFWSGKRVLLTGHTGFKGGWAALWLHRLGANVTGIGLRAPDPGLHGLAGIDSLLDAHIGDLRHAKRVTALVRRTRPEIVLHLAAQPLVRRALAQPLETFATNIMGTANLLNALRECPPPQAALIITTDKVYARPPQPRAHPETDALGGHDPYAASKSAVELVTAAMAHSYLEPAGTRVATARAGNVIGGGDFAPDRLVPDIVRAVRAGQAPVIRNPEATRPWQHVLDCLCGYFLLLEALVQGRDVPTALNFGPDGSATVTDVTEAILGAFGQEQLWRRARRPDRREAAGLALDSSLARATLGWRDRLTGSSLMMETADWYRAWAAGADMRAYSLGRIAAYEAIG
jgi:CDP-glucose 4,6-dehydratase